MRIVGGCLRGRVFDAPDDAGVRPTSDRLRESVFNILVHRYFDDLNDARVLDIFSGSGAYGFEALSRGASFALLIDKGVEACRIIQGNIEKLGILDRAQVLKKDAVAFTDFNRFEPFTSASPFSLVFCDPPYRKGLAPLALKSAANHGWFLNNALIVVEEAEDFELLPCFELLEKRVYGLSQISFLRFQDALNQS